LFWLKIRFGHADLYFVTSEPMITRLLGELIKNRLFFKDQFWSSWGTLPNGRVSARNLLLRLPTLVSRLSSTCVRIESTSQTARER